MTPLEIGNPVMWAQFGLAGLTVFTLLVTLYAVIRYGVDRFDTVDARNRALVKDLATTHKDERQEWRSEMLESNRRLETAIRDLAIALHTSRGAAPSFNQHGHSHFDRRED